MVKRTKWKRFRDLRILSPRPRKYRCEPCSPAASTRPGPNGGYVAPPLKCSLPSTPIVIFRNYSFHTSPARRSKGTSVGGVVLDLEISSIKEEEEDRSLTSVALRLVSTEWGTKTSADESQGTSGTLNEEVREWANWKKSNLHLHSVTLNCKWHHAQNGSVWSQKRKPPRTVVLFLVNSKVLSVLALRSLRTRYVFMRSKSLIRTTNSFLEMCGTLANIWPER